MFQQGAIKIQKQRKYQKVLRAQRLGQQQRRHGHAQRRAGSETGGKQMTHFIANALNRPAHSFAGERP